MSDKGHKTGAEEHTGAADMPMPDPAAFASNMMKVSARSQRLIADFLAREGLQDQGPQIPDPMNLAEAFTSLMTAVAAHPQKVADAQMSLWANYLDLWQTAASRMAGNEAAPKVAPERGDKRFKDAGWNEAVFDFIKQSYLVTARWIMETVHDIDTELEPKDRQKLEFYTKQFVDALSPSNFVMTNPEVLRATVESNGENLVRGLENLLEDLERGKGKIAIRQTDLDAFEVGRNLALTPGKVIYQNDLMQLLQYTPTTETVYKQPLLIIPPWINKFYILDLQPKNSFIKWAVAQGYTVFVVSWVNPDERQADKTFEDYMKEGIFAALDAIEKATGERQVSAIGYCIGGTLLTATLSLMAARGDDRIANATFFASQSDFKEAGELTVFIDEPQIEHLEEQMKSRGGYLEGSKMANAFNMLRSNDLIWSFVVNNYLLGKDPFPFDLLYWNSDSTNMPYRMHAFYLRECYLKNNLAEGRMVLGGETLDVGKVKIPVYMQSSKEDHIAPVKSVYRGAKLYGGPVRFMVAGSGHIAGVINHPDANKYQHWLSEARKLPPTFEQWFEKATEYPGSWWPDWDKWLSRKSGPKVPARQPGDGKLAPIEDAPGSYVKMKGG